MGGKGRKAGKGGGLLAAEFLRKYLADALSIYDQVPFYP